MVLSTGWQSKDTFLFRLSEYLNEIKKERKRGFENRKPVLK